jgi:hypothetical protein
MPRPKPIGSKRCPKCKEAKPLGQFYASGKYDGGYSPYCKPCMRANNAARTPAQKELYANAQRGTYPKRKAGIIAYQARLRAKRQKEDPARWRAKKFFDVNRRDVAADVTIDYLAGLFHATSRCQCCDCILELKYIPKEERRSRMNPRAPSIDRVNNDAGYARSNIAVICWGCNAQKSDLTLDDLDRLRKYISVFGSFDDVD